jgi:hypothetical protein
VKHVADTIVCGKSRDEVEMKLNGFVIIMLMGILLVGSVSCLASAASKPTASDVPEGWSLSNEEPFGTYLESDGTQWGLVEYTNSDELNFVQIYYGNVPRELIDHETDPDYLTARAILESKTFEPDETGNIIASGQIAGYTKRYDPDSDWYEMDIVFVLESACIDIYTIYDATPEAEEQAMSIINSISF